MSAFLLPTHKVSAKVFRQKKCHCSLPKPLSKCWRRGRRRSKIEMPVWAGDSTPKQNRALFFYRKKAKPLKQEAHPSFLTPFPLTQTLEKKKKNLASRAPLPGASRSRCRRLAPGAAATPDACPNRRLPIPSAPKSSLAGAPQPTALAPTAESNGRHRPNP